MRAPWFVTQGQVHIQSVGTWNGFVWTRDTVSQSEPSCGKSHIKTKHSFHSPFDTHDTLKKIAEGGVGGGGGGGRRGKGDVKWTRMVKVGQVKFLAVDEALRSIFWPAGSWTKRGNLPRVINWFAKIRLFPLQARKKISSFFSPLQVITPRYDLKPQQSGDFKSCDRGTPAWVAIRCT